MNIELCDFEITVTGKERIADGEELSIEEANSMQWFYPNVIDNWADKPE